MGLHPTLTITLMQNFNQCFSSKQCSCAWHMPISNTSCYGVILNHGNSLRVTDIGNTLVKSSLGQYGCDHLGNLKYSYLGKGSFNCGSVNKDKHITFW